MSNHFTPRIPKYKKLADDIEAAIRIGTYEPGERLPSLRQTALTHAVSLSTVLEAYRCLEDAQLIETRPKAGHFVTRWPGGLLEPEVSTPPAYAAPVAVAELIEMVMNSAGMPDLISFGSGYPTVTQLPTGKIERAMTKAIQQSAGALSRYPVALGHDGLRKTIAQRSLSLGCILDPNEIVLTTGATEAISLCLCALLKPGDTVALESPTSFGFLQILEALKLRALEIPTHPRYGLSVDALSLALRDLKVDAILATPTLSNPMGTSMPIGERKRLAELVTQRQIPLIEDVIYNDLSPSDTLRRAVKSFDKDGWVLTCSSYSKTVAPGLRIGWLQAGRFSERVRMLKTAFSGGNCAINEITLMTLLAESSYSRQLRRLHKINHQVLQEARQIIESSFPPGTRVTNPDGGSTLWLELPSNLDSQILFKACLDDRILIVPGTIFSASRSYLNCIRLNIPGSFEILHIRALQRIGEIASSLLGKFDL
ncbi:PLP-dependent aminotransferase family protein [Comamonas testosteroni]|uniref:aminotransferase-like domain-containing protein n=1 Tax=Comamonas testosteroni TaxID=285 RepID=UPI0015FC2473|nr:PLP-dependent aminotransferase family protein [Comamonas testosteroni]